MKILFIHQNFPGQFRYLAPALAERGHEVSALAMGGEVMEGVAQFLYRPTQNSTPGVHPWVVDFETKVIRAEGILLKVLEMKSQGYYPDAIVAHHGWGESLFIKEVWPNAPLGIYCEFFYHAHGFDLDFDPEFYLPNEVSGAAMAIKNINNRLHFDFANAGIVPTHWQKSTFPEPFRSRISVVHEGVDTQLCQPKLDVALHLNEDVRLTREDEVITFVNRNLEPYRGYHVFMRSLPEILKERPQAQVFIIGGDGVSYGHAPPEGRTWKEIYLQEVSDKIDLSRVHFLGQVAYPIYLALLQISTVHVYLTYPFVLSWSCIEAMSVGCAIVGSDTSPVREVITHNETGRLVNFLSPSEISSQVIDLIENPSERERLGFNARQYVLERYDRNSVCLPQQIEWVEKIFI